MTNEIVMTGECDFKDHEVREWLSRIGTKIETLNDRTKSHTIQIRELRNKIKELRKEWKKN